MYKDITVNCACYKGYSLENALQYVAAAGYKMVELPCMRGWCEMVSPDMQESELEEVQKLLTKYGLSVPAVAAHVDFLSGPDAFEWLERSIPLAKKLGATIVITSPGEGEYEERLEKLRKLDTICGDYGVQLALEPHGTLCTGKQLKQAILEAGTKNVVINYDTANVLFFGGVNPLEDMPEAMDRIGYVHVKDKRGGQGVWDFPAAGEGELPIAALLSVLKQNKYDGIISAEIEFTPEGPESLEEINRSIQASLTYLKSIEM